MHDDKNFDKLKEMVGYESLPAEYGGPETNVLDDELLYDYLEKNAKLIEQVQAYKKVLN